jgi:hypothetical protein
MEMAGHIKDFVKNIWESRKRRETDQNILLLPQFKNFQRHECFDDSRFCLIFSFGGNYEILEQNDQLLHS